MLILWFQYYILAILCRKFALKYMYKQIFHQLQLVRDFCHNSDMYTILNISGAPPNNKVILVND